MELDLSDVKPSILNLITTGILAIVFIVLAKWLVNSMDNPVTNVFKDVINAV